MPRRRSKIVEGIAASPGIHVGLVHLVDRRRLRAPKNHLSDKELPAEVRRFQDAVAQSIVQLEGMQKKLRRGPKKEPLGILEAHLMMMRDEMLIGDTVQLIRSEAINAEWALRQVVVRIRQVFDTIEDDYFRERRSDVEFVGDRIMRNLLGQDTEIVLPPDKRAVLVAHDVSPADTINLGRSAVGAFVTEVGSKTSHTSIIARALEVPAVVGVKDFLPRVGSGDQVIVDGYRGQVIVHPSRQQVEEALARSQGLRDQAAAMASERALPARTRDGRQQVRLLANIEMAEDVATALRYGAEGIGLYRTEFMFMGSRAPSEGFQYRSYRKIIEAMTPLPTTIRTMDLGGDKSQILFPHGVEANPALGLRSIRLSLRHKPVFLAQLRALLRASTAGKLKILFPMISCLQELRQALDVLEEAKRQLRAKDQPFDEHVQVGIMIEVPSAAFLSDKLAPQVDFFSIGTNDLIQYLLAVDRMNERVAYLYNPLHVSVLRLLKHVVSEAHRAGITVSMCGEMAGSPQYAPILIGLGLDEISMNPSALPYARHLIRHCSRTEATRLVGQLMRQPDTEAIGQFMREWLARRFPDLFTAAGPNDILGGL